MNSGAHRPSCLSSWFCLAVEGFHSSHSLPVFDRVLLLLTFLVVTLVLCHNQTFPPLIFENYLVHILDFPHLGGMSCSWVGFSYYTGTIKIKLTPAIPGSSQRQWKWSWTFPSWCVSQSELIWKTGFTYIWFVYNMKLWSCVVSYECWVCCIFNSLSASYVSVVSYKMYTKLDLILSVKMKYFFVLLFKVIFQNKIMGLLSVLSLSIIIIYEKGELFIRSLENIRNNCACNVFQVQKYSLRNFAKPC